jgi:hypothetical protein
VVALAPVEQVALARGGSVGEVCAATTWMNRRGSASRRASSDACGRWKGTDDLLITLSIFTQRSE